FFSSRRRHTSSKRDWSSDVCSSDLGPILHRSPRHSTLKVIRRREARLRVTPNRAGGVSVRAPPWHLLPSIFSVRSTVLLRVMRRSEERRVGKEGRARGVADSGRTRE